MHSTYKGEGQILAPEYMWQSVKETWNDGRTHRIRVLDTENIWHFPISVTRDTKDILNPR